MRHALMTLLAILPATTGHALPPLACEDVGGLPVMTIEGNRLHIRHAPNETATLPLTPLDSATTFPRAWTTHLNDAPATLILDELPCAIASGTFPLRYYLLTGQPAHHLQHGCCTVAE